VGATVDRHAEEVRDAVIVRRRGDRLAVGRPCWSAQQVKRIGTTRAFVPSACITYKSVLSMLLNREGDIPSIRRDSRAAKDSRSLTAPQFRASSVGELPDTLARTGCRTYRR